MPRFTYPLQNGELSLPVLVGLGALEAQARQVTGLPLPPPQWCTCLIDTGTNVSCVAGHLLRQLGTVPVQQATSYTTAGAFTADIYHVSSAFRRLGQARPC